MTRDSVCHDLVPGRGKMSCLRIGYHRPPLHSGLGFKYTLEAMRSWGLRKKKLSVEVHTPKMPFGISIEDDFKILNLK